MTCLTLTISSGRRRRLLSSSSQVSLNPKVEGSTFTAHSSLATDSALPRRGPVPRASPFGKMTCPIIDPDRAVPSLSPPTAVSDAPSGVAFARWPRRSPPRPRYGSRRPRLAACGAAAARDAAVSRSTRASSAPTSSRSST
jgi:hypothetical protein